MKTAKLQVIVWFFLIVSTLVTYRVITSELAAPDLKQARLTYETEKLQLERAQLKRFDALETERFRVKQASLQRENDLTFYGMLGLLSASGLALLILAVGYSRARVKRASVYIARIGQHSEIPIHQKDLQSFYPIAVNLSLAEIEASVSTAHEKAYRISRQMIDDITAYTRALAGKRGMAALGTGQRSESQQGEVPAMAATPTFAALLHKGAIAPGKPLILGYDRQGQPQYRALHDLKSVAIAGWQGSGKTLSTGYLVAASILANGVQVYIIDPHKHHPESLAALIKPLEKTGHVTVMNPFDTPALIAELNRTLDRRLSGQEPNEPGILLVIDEMARLATMDCFDILIAFLERCTEETRKANITFIGGSHKWTARHFKGRADIRGCMNSMLVHKTKPSQADLLLEDAHDKNLVKQLHRPGDAILVTDYSAPVLVSLPRCTREDMHTVADIVQQMSQTTTSPQAPLTIPVEEKPSVPAQEKELQAEARLPQAQFNHPPVKPVERIPTISKNLKSKKRRKLSDVIPFEFHLKKRQTAHQTASHPTQLTAAMLQAQWQKRKTQEAHLTQAEMARQAGLSPSHFSKILKGQCPLQDKYKQQLYQALFGNERLSTPVETR